MWPKLNNHEIFFCILNLGLEFIGLSVCVSIYLFVYLFKLKRISIEKTSSKPFHDFDKMIL